MFTVHGVGGFIGNLLTGVFAERRWSELDGEILQYSGLIEGETVIYWQLAASIACFAWSFFMTCIILFVINKIPGLSLKLESADQLQGIDAAEMGETTYDYVKMLNEAPKKTKDASTWTGNKPVWFKKAESDE